VVGGNYWVTNFLYVGYFMGSS